MNRTLDEQLMAECQSDSPDIEKTIALIRDGADPNLETEYDYSVFASLFAETLTQASEQRDTAYTKATIDKLKKLTEVLIDSGWNIKKYLPDVIHRLIFSTSDCLSFEMIKHFLNYDFAENRETYENLLKSIGTEESYQRCCEHNHERENLFYTMYEIVEAKMEERDFQPIGLYYDAVGQKIDNIIYFAEKDSTVKTDSFSEYNADIGFVCGNKLLVVRNSVNILFMNQRINENPQINIPDLFGTQVIGATITDVSFRHKEIIKDTTCYGQPIIKISLDSGFNLNFTHNFGELSDNQVQPRFYVTEG